MPAFTFEKISPPVRRGAAPETEKKPRGVVVRMIDRLFDTRVKRAPISPEDRHGGRQLPR